MAEPIEDSTREYDIVANILPIGLKEGDYIDFRIVYPLGEDYIVLFINVWKRSMVQQ